MLCGYRKYSRIIFSRIHICWTTPKEDSIFISWQEVMRHYYDWASMTSNFLGTRWSILPLVYLTTSDRNINDFSMTPLDSGRAHRILVALIIVPILLQKRPSTQTILQKILIKSFLPFPSLQKIKLSFYLLIH